MFSYKNMILMSAVAAQDTTDPGDERPWPELPATFLSDIVVMAHTPIDESAGWIAEGTRRNPGACFFTDPAYKRDSTEYWVLNGERTNSEFGNDCLEWTFTRDQDGYYIV